MNLLPEICSDPERLARTLCSNIQRGASLRAETILGRMGIWGATEEQARAAFSFAVLAGWLDNPSRGLRSLKEGPLWYVGAAWWLRAPDPATLDPEGEHEDGPAR